MRFDSVGLFWEDEVHDRKRGVINRPQPPIPDTSWALPREFPNLRGVHRIAFDTETYDPNLLDLGPGWARNDGHVVGVSVAVDGGQWYFPIRHTVEPENNLDPVHVFTWLRDTLGQPCPKIGANLLYDIGWLNHEGVAVRGELIDVQFAESLLDELAEVNLDALGVRYLDVGKDTSLLYQWCCDFYGGNPNGSQRANIWRSPARLVGPYAEADATIPLRVASMQYERLRREGLLDVFQMECALIPLLIAMRWRGVKVDTSKAEIARDELKAHAQTLQQQLNALVGMEVNVGASDSIAKAFDSLGLPYSRTAKGRPSFTKLFLENVDHELADLIIGIRKVDKLRATFVESYVLEANVNGRVHCQFHPLRGDGYGARSGRLSSSDPNLQNIPSRDKKLAPVVRGLFLPDYGRWRRFDYSQIEYRFLAHYAVGEGSDEIRRRYNTDPKTDYHDATREMIQALLGLILDRYPVKTTNFGLTYGMGKRKLIRSLGLDQRAGERFFENYHRAVPFAAQTLEACAKEAETSGIITTILGRRSRFDLWEPAGRDGRDFAALTYELACINYGKIKRAYLHKALNRRLQGSAADMMKLAMVRAYQAGIFDVVGVPHVTVHDELGFSDGMSVAENEAWRELQHVMETCIRLSIPVRVDVEVGPDWGHVAKLAA